MTIQSYHIAWIVYLLSATGLTLIFWQLAKLYLPVPLRKVLLISLIVILYTPYFSEPTQDWLAPAILVALFETVFGDYHIGLKAAVPLVTLLATVIIFNLVARRRATTPETPAATPASSG